MPSQTIVILGGGMIPWWVMALMIFGANFTLWGLIGMVRLLESSARRWLPRRGIEPVYLMVGRRGRLRGVQRPTRLGVEDVAVLIAAHNEELVIEDSLRAITSLVPAENVHVVSDGSTDRTVELARRCGVNVISTSSNVGKAGALQEGIAGFELADRFPVVMLLDADTHVEPGYFDAALPQFCDPQVVAVAGCVRTNWEGRALSWFGRIVACHRERIYTTTQYLLKFGQTWRRTNATHIVPGFASVYRTDVLPLININPPGLVIEDFNMTFEVYQKRLGKVGFTPAAVAATQDPNSLRDYVRQSKRWALGLWQTVRLHPPRPNLFTAAVAMLLIESLTSSIMLALLPLVVLILAIPQLFGVAATWPVFGDVYAALAGYVSLTAVLFGVVVPDLTMTCLVALFRRQPRFLLFAPFFLLLRVLDAAIGLYAVPLAWISNSTGRWRSPARRSVATDAPSRSDLRAS